MHKAGQKIRQWRREQKPALSAEEFARRFGFAIAPVYRWETQGLVASPETIRRLQQEGICALDDWFLPADQEAA